MAAKLNFFEKLAVTFGPIWRYQKSRFPHRYALFSKVVKRELAPPTKADWPVIKKDFAKLANAIETKAYKNYTLGEFLIYVGVGAELVFWFVAGECIGRRNMFGYIVPGDYVSKSVRKQAAATPVDDKKGF